MGTSVTLLPRTGKTLTNQGGFPRHKFGGGATPLGNTAPPQSGDPEIGLEPTPGLGNTEAALDASSNSERQRAGNNTSLAQAEHYRHMTSSEETAKPAKLRTYVDDWRLFKSGNHRAATTLVESLVTTCHALEGKGMKVSRDKTVMLASHGTASKHLRQAAGPELRHMISLE
eukprot:16442189-Heterocapsa_arctica.AAC.1